MNSVSAATPQDLNGDRYAVPAAGPMADRAPRDIVAGAVATTYTATFVPISADLGGRRRRRPAAGAGRRSRYDPERRAGRGRGVTLVDTLPSKLTIHLGLTRLRLRGGDATRDVQSRRACREREVVIRRWS